MSNDANKDTQTKSETTYKKQKINWMGPYALPAFRYTMFVIVLLLLLAVIVGGCYMRNANNQRIEETQAWIDAHQIH